MHGFQEGQNQALFQTSFSSSCHAWACASISHAYVSISCSSCEDSCFVASIQTHSHCSWVCSRFVLLCLLVAFDAAAFDYFAAPTVDIEDFSFQHMLRGLELCTSVEQRHDLCREYSRNVNIARLRLHSEKFLTQVPLLIHRMVLPADDLLVRLLFYSNWWLFHSDCVIALASCWISSADSLCTHYQIQRSASSLHGLGIRRPDCIRFVRISASCWWISVRFVLFGLLVISSNIHTRSGFSRKEANWCQQWWKWKWQGRRSEHLPLSATRIKSAKRQFSRSFNTHSASTFIASVSVSCLAFTIGFLFFAREYRYSVIIELGVQTPSVNTSKGWWMLGRWERRKSPFESEWRRGYGMRLGCFIWKRLWWGGWLRRW